MSNVVIKNLKVSYEDKVIFDSFNVEFEENKVNVILGSSGVGKTTILNCIAGILPYDGSIEGHEDGVSYIFQKDRLIPTISIYKNLDLILKTKIKDKKERKEKILKMLSLLEIEDCAKKYTTEMSGGQIQRAAIARAFLYPSNVILLDEPFKALDTSLKSKLIKVLIELHREERKTVIFVTHAIDECLLAADNVYVFANNPVEIIYNTKIEKDAMVRTLIDPELDVVRKELLSIVAKDAE
ncbi:MAG: ABC transporter ATP-binding protein [Clostridia bacterium]|nr:ABC transporter ATP-binding protein [Clostridia bacterium]